jgi:hypothetical protein
VIFRTFRTRHNLATLVAAYRPLADKQKSIGIVGKSTSLLASGIYGIVKIVATAIFIFFGVERVGRRTALIVGVGLMSMFLWMIGAIFNTHSMSFLCQVGSEGKGNELTDSSGPTCYFPKSSFYCHGRFDLPIRHSL